MAKRHKSKERAPQEKPQKKKEEKPRFTVTDRRFWAVEDKEDEVSDRCEYPTYVEKLKDEIEQKDRLLKDYISQFKEAKKEYEEFKERLNRNMSREIEHRTEQFMVQFLEILDNLERSLLSAQDSRNFDALHEGIKLIYDQFLKKLQNLGVREIESVGKQFDPHIHEAVSVISVQEEDKNNIVLQEVRKGYMMNDRVIRPSMVVVGKYEQAEDKTPSDEVKEEKLLH
jgi:molecular chaperone GrpE